MSELTIDGERLVGLFLDLIKIDSESGNEAGVRDYLQKNLAQYEIVSNVDAYGNLIVSLPGNGLPLLLAAHMDTVKPGCGVKPVLKDGMITSDGTTILGADDKSAISVMLYTLIELKKNNIPHRSLEVVFTREEELGAYGAKNLDYSLITAKEALVLDHTAKPGKVVLGAPFLSDIYIKIVGQSAHASKPESGINAIAVAVSALGKLKIGRIDKETTTNVGIMNGGLISNGVPEEVNLVAEVRSHNKVKHDQLLVVFKEKFEAAAAKYGARLDFTANNKVIGYEVNKKGALYKSVTATWKKLKIETWGEKIGGVTDANVLNQHGIEAIPLGSGGQHAHTTRESIYVGEITDLARFLMAFVTGLAKK